MLDVHIDPNGSDDSYKFVTVATLDEAMDLVRERFPNAVRSIGWMKEVGDTPIEAAWYDAMLEVWPDHQTKERDPCGEYYCALISHRGLNPPEPDAKLLDGGVEVAY
jgi:hypothetical protein